MLGASSIDSTYLRGDLGARVDNEDFTVGHPHRPVLHTCMIMIGSLLTMRVALNIWFDMHCARGYECAYGGRFEPVGDGVGAAVAKPSVERRILRHLPYKANKPKNPKAHQ